jgi:DNA invertase Pin-like site-specific DNA recombinase
MRAALYTRVSTTDQHCENQTRELRAYCQARDWTIIPEYSDQGFSGAKADRPALNELRKDARRRAFDTVLVWKLDRAGRSLTHLVSLVQEFHDRGINFVSLNEGIDFATAAGRLQFALLAGLVEFERDRLRERVFAGLARAKAQGRRLGRPRALVPLERLQRAAIGSLDEAARALGVSRSTVKRWRRQLRQVQQSRSA